jgi:hypothetical protein
MKNRTTGAGRRATEKRDELAPFHVGRKDSWQKPSHGDAHGTSYACFSFLCKVASELTQGSAERNQFCRRGTKSRRWRKIPTRTM